MLRDFLNFRSWQHRRRSNSARLPQFSKLTTSKTKQFCETSSIFEVDSIEDEAILRDFLNFRSWHQKRSISAKLPSKMESWVQSWRPNASTPSVWTTAPATKKWSQVIQSAAPVTQNHLGKPEGLMLQNATPLKKWAPWPPNISDEHVSCTARATRNPSLQIFFKRPTPANVFETDSLLTTCRIPCAFHAEQHPNLKNCSETASFLHFWLRNVLRATHACHTNPHFISSRRHATGRKQGSTCGPSIKSTEKTRGLRYAFGNNFPPGLDQLPPPSGGWIPDRIAG